jgi:prolipoprotein diacylglyceryl transferase
MITQNIDPIILHIGFLQLRWYSLLFVGSFVLGFFIIKKIFLLEGKDVDSLDDLLVYTLLGAIIGARLAHCFFYEPHYYLSHPVEILYIWKGGLASHGGMVGVLVVFYFYTKKHNFSFMWLISRMSIPGSIVAASVRFGNFFNSEILGKESHLPWAIVFKRVDNIPRHPVQLYEAFSYLSLAVLLWVVYKKATPIFATKLLPGLFALVMFSVRFLLEFAKTRQADYILSIPLSVGQLLSLPLIFIGIVWVIWAFTTTPKEVRWH